MPSIPYNAQDVRDPMNTFINSPQSSTDWWLAHRRLSDIEDNASHYVIKRRASAAIKALYHMYLYHKYPAYHGYDQFIRTIAAMGKEYTAGEAIRSITQ